MARLRANFKTGTITDSPLTAGAVTINSPEFAALPVVAAPNYMPLALDPEGINGAPEIVWITDHASTATSVTVTRHQEGTLARSHPAASIWANTLTAQDIDELYAAVDAVTAALPSYLPLAGGVMTGLLTLSAAPTADLHAATKKYVDDHTSAIPYLPLTGGTLTGFLNLHADPTAALHAATKQYADTKSASNHNHSGVYSPVAHTHSYAAVSHTHAYAPTSHSHSYLPLSGGTITGDVTFSGSGSSLFVGGYIIGEQRLYLGNPLSTSNNGLPGWRHNTSAEPTFGWEFMRLTSSLRYKRSVKPIDTDRLVAELRIAASKLISWQEKGSPQGSPRYLGISAEDAFEIVPTAVVLDADGLPDAVEPVNAFGVHMIAAIGNLLDRVDALEV